MERMKGTWSLAEDGVEAWAERGHKKEWRGGAG